VRLIPADVDVWASEDGRNAGEYLGDHFKGRRQLWIKPCGVALMTGLELKLDEVSTRVQFREHPHERGRVPRCVDLGNNGDEALLSVGCEPAQVFHAVEAVIGFGAAGRPSHGEAPALFVGQVQMQHVELVERKEVDHPPDLIHGKKSTGEIE